MNDGRVNFAGVSPALRGAAIHARRALIAGAQRLESGVPAMARVEDITVRGADGPLPARLYLPEGAKTPGPAILFFHGGGFLVGDLDSHDTLCKRLADAAGMRVIAIAYRLAPKHKFPSAPEDCYAAMLWAERNGEQYGIDTALLAVAGDSAGGNLATVTALMARDRCGPRLFAQALLYPCTQLVEMRLPQLQIPRGAAIAQSAQDWFRNAYLSSAEHAHDPRCSPLLATSHADLPPAYVLTAGVDPLRGEGVAYAEALARAGVDVTTRDYPSMVHGFLNLTVILPAARDAIAAAGRWLRAKANAAAHDVSRAAPR